MCVLIIRLLSAYIEIFFANSRVYLMILRSKRPFTIPLYLILRKRSFPKELDGSLPKEGRIDSL